MQRKAAMSVPLLDLKAQHRRIEKEVEAAVKNVLDSQRFILGPEVAELEKEVASYSECAYGIGCASGSDALLLALMACGIGQGDEVITTPFSFFATASSIVRLGAKPVFVDIEEGTFNIAVDLIESFVTERTKAILPVHLFGQCADMYPICRIAEQRGLSVIEDAAQAIGAEYKGRRAGGIGTVSAFSFYPSKNLGGAGDGGLITTSDAKLAEELKTLRSHGARNKYFHEMVGINSRLDALQAAILRVKLRHLDEWAASRRKNARLYGELFKQSGLLESGAVSLPHEPYWSHHVYNQFVIRCKERDDLRSYLSDRGIGTEIYYPLPLHLQECFKDLGYSQGQLPQSERAAKEALAIPVYPELDPEAQEYVVNTISAFYV
jgi:dTDP-4-amino-4,6-dideoxygalactose transaminase